MSVGNGRRVVVDLSKKNELLLFDMIYSGQHNFVWGWLWGLDHSSQDNRWITNNMFLTRTIFRTIF